MIRHVLPLFVCVSLLSAAEAPVPVPATAPTPPPAPAEQVLRAPEPGRFKQLFQPFRTDLAALSPDGKYIAYSVREGETLSVVVIEIDHPEKMKAHVQVVDDDSATPMLAQNQAEKTPARINWMKWVTANRLVVETNKVFARSNGGDWQSLTGAIIRFDADGSNAKLLVSPDDLPEIADDSSSANPFSVGRRNSSGFDSRVTTPDKPAAAFSDTVSTSTSTEATSAANASSMLTPDASGIPDTPNYGATQPRTLRIFDLDAQNPGAVSVIATGPLRGSGSYSLGLYSLDTQTGKLKEVNDDLVTGTKTALLDRQGRVRLTLPNSLVTSFPYRYDYLGAKGTDFPHALDGTAGLTGFTVSPDNFFGARSIPLGFDEDPNVLYYASNVGRDTFGIYSLDLTTKQHGKLALENPAYDLIGPPAAGFPESSTLVFDRYQHQLAGVRYDNAFRTTAWIRPEWQGMQTKFEKMFPGRSIEITDWNEAGNRFVINTQGPADPGAFFVYDRAKGQLLEFVRRAPWVDANHTHLTLPFSYAAKDGAKVSGLVTVPQQPRLKPIPMVVLCPDLPWERVRSDFQAEVQALADMGFVVVQLNGRGAWGLGLKQRQSLTSGYDLVQIDDLTTSVTNLGKIFNVNPHRVALMGHGHGGFIALRALQAYPDQFRCAIALDAPVNLGDWLAEQKWSSNDVQPQLTRAWLGDAERIKAAPLTSHPETITKPILLLTYPGPEGEPRRSAYAAARNFAAKVKNRGGTVEFADLSTDYVRGLPAARAAVFDHIEQFLNTHVYNFNVKLREMEIIK